MPHLIRFIPFFLFIDALVLSSAKSVLIQFLTGTINPKNLNAFHRRQKWMDQLTLNYIGPLLKKHRKEFHFLHRLYSIVLYASLPQAFLLLLLSFFITAGGAARIVFYVMLLPRIIFAVIFWAQCDSCRQLKCVQKK